MDHAWGYGSEQRLRDENEDCYGVFEFPDYTLAIVCDGMGGHVGGAQASSLAVRHIYEAMRDLGGTPLPEALTKALQQTNLVIYEAARKNHRLMGMGTTCVVAAVRDNVAIIAHVGDSRAYRVHDGKADLLTRDHTMVNLFVEAGLLTPEDAATHPEAHVLSRSLGGERQVDVDVSGPIQLGQNDALVLCSDGVHGVLHERDLEGADWGAPHAAVRRLLDLVTSREGDDNATAVAILLGTTFEDVPPTPVPEPKRVEDPGLSALTAVPAEDEASFDSTPEYRRTPDSGGASYIVYDDAPAATPAPSATPAPAKPVEPPPPAAPVVAQPVHTPVQKPKSSTGKVVPVLAGMAIAGLGLAAAALFLLAPSESVEVTPELPPVEAVVKVTTPDPAPPVAPVDAPTPEPTPDPVPEDVVAEPLAIFAPELPSAPRRLPHRATRFTQPPPGGQIQWVAVQASRNKECAKALDEVQRGMATSIDYARLYVQAWLCFVDAHQRPLEQARVTDWQDFIFILPHLEGAPEERNRKVQADPALSSLPSWYWPAVDGIEFRLERYADSDQNDQLVDVLNDQFGEPTVADHLAKDLHMVALAAAGLSSVEPPADKVTDWQARRVYVATRALNGRVGRTIERHRPELIPVIRDLLEQATTPQLGDDERPRPVPDAVLTARDVALGVRPPPSKKAEKKVEYVPPKEPSLEDLQDDYGAPRVQRSGER